MSAKYWTEKRAKIYEWMMVNNLPSYADLYKGAVVNLFDQTPGYVRFVAHAVRDIGNGMAAHKLGRQRKQVDYVNMVGRLATQWKASGLPKGTETLMPSEDIIAVSADGSLYLSKEVVGHIQQLLREHEEGRRRSEETAFLFFLAFLPNSTQRNTLPQAYIDMWQGIQKWFVANCHENGKMPSKEVKGQIQAKFEQLEEILCSVANRYTNTIKTVNEILDRANS